jgi:hypothetical protein
MPNYSVFFAGSDQRVADPKHVYVDWATDLARQGYLAVLCDGVGKFTGTSGTTGAGWAKIVQHAMNMIESSGPPDRVIVVGMSRGGVQALVFAHCMRQAFPTAKLFVFAVDPVQGGHIQNDGSFDLRDNRNLFRRFGSRGSRDDLKDRYRLSDAAPNTVPDNVDFYLTALMQFRGSTRAFWGFTPQAPSLGNINGLRQHRHATYEIPGDHGYGVYTGDDGAKGVNQSRQARGRVTREMFAHHCREAGFGSVDSDPSLVALNHYCRIANEDLAGSQGQSKATGYSFLEASRKARVWGNPFQNPSASNGWAKGRGHMVACTQAIAGKGYFVNARHRALYRLCRPRIEEVIARGRAEMFERTDQILPWLQANANFAAHAEQDRERYRAFLEALAELF